MKQHLHKTMELFPDDIIKFDLDADAFVAFMDDQNYFNYINDMDYDYFGTTVTQSPFYMSPPEHGLWHIVVAPEDSAKPLNAKIDIVEGQK